MDLDWQLCCRAKVCHLDESENYDLTLANGFRFQS